jgi:hypothetical protein
MEILTSYFKTKNSRNKNYFCGAIFNGGNAPALTLFLLLYRLTLSHSYYGSGGRMNFFPKASISNGFQNIKEKL